MISSKKHLRMPNMAWETELEQDLKWREDELAAMKFAVTQTVIGTAPHKALLRAAWAMLYAHYEGFCLSRAEYFPGRSEKERGNT